MGGNNCRGKMTGFRTNLVLFLASSVICEKMEMDMEMDMPPSAPRDERSPDAELGPHALHHGPPVHHGLPLHHGPPVHHAPVHHAPVHHIPVHHAPVHHAPLHKAPLHHAPAPYAPPVPVHPKPAPYAPPPVHHAPAYKEPARPYQYEYGVADQYSGAQFAETQTQDEAGVVKGSYSVALPDGRTQIVNYHADHHGGYVAEVTYEGTAVYPPGPALHHPGPIHLAASEHAPVYAPAPKHVP